MCSPRCGINIILLNCACFRAIFRCMTHVVVQWFFVCTVLLAIAVSFWIYFFNRSYLFVVEAPCDPAYAECFMRDCATHECPPQGLSLYREFEVPAQLFDSCTDATCSNICVSQGSCVERLCHNQQDIPCSSAVPAL